MEWWEGEEKESSRDEGKGWLSCRHLEKGEGLGKGGGFLQMKQGCFLFVCLCFAPKKPLNFFVMASAKRFLKKEFFKERRKEEEVEKGKDIRQADR